MGNIDWSFLNPTTLLIGKPLDPVHWSATKVPQGKGSSDSK